MAQSKPPQRRSQGMSIMEMSTRKWLVLCGVGISSMLVAIDFTIVNTVLAQIQSTFNASLNTLQWIMTGFGITFSAFLISAGRLADLFGRRLLLYIGMFGFGITSLGAGLSETITFLIVCRVLQGVFGAIIYPSGLAITSDAFPSEEQGRALGIYGSLLGIGLAIGPVLGGIITSLANWHWIFLINVPVMLISFVICLSSVRESKINEKVIVDWLGMFLIVISLALFVFAVTQSEKYGWDQPIIYIPFILAILLFMGLLFIEKKIPMPLLPPKLFLNNQFIIGTTIYSVCVGLVWTIIFFVPLYLQNVLHMDELKTGLLLLPMTLMTIIAPTIAGFIYDKEGPRLTTIVAFLLSIVGYILFLFFSPVFSWLIVLSAFICIGLSWGIGNGIALPLALSGTNDKQNQGLISGASVTVLNVFAVLILSISSALFHHRYNVSLSEQHHSIYAFLNGFHAVIILLFIITILGFIVVSYLFKRR